VYSNGNDTNGNHHPHHQQQQQQGGGEGETATATSSSYMETRSKKRQRIEKGDGSVDRSPVSKVKVTLNKNRKRSTNGEVKNKKRKSNVGMKELKEVLLNRFYKHDENNRSFPSPYNSFHYNASSVNNNNRNQQENVLLLDSNEAMANNSLIITKKLLLFTGTNRDYSNPNYVIEYKSKEQLTTSDLFLSLTKLERFRVTGIMHSCTSYGRQKISLLHSVDDVNKLFTNCCNLFASLQWIDLGYVDYSNSNNSKKKAEQLSGVQLFTKLIPYEIIKCKDLEIIMMNDLKYVWRCHAKHFSGNEALSDYLIFAIETDRDYNRIICNLREHLKKPQFLCTRNFSHIVVWKNIPERNGFIAAGYLAHFKKKKYHILSQIGVISEFRRMGLAMHLYQHFKSMAMQSETKNKNDIYQLAVEDPEPECSSLLYKAEGDNLDNVIACYDREIFFQLSSWIAEYYEEEYDSSGKPTGKFHYLNNIDEDAHQQRLMPNRRMLELHENRMVLAVTIDRSYLKKRIHVWFVSEDLKSVFYQADIEDKNKRDGLHVISPFIIANVALEKCHSYNFVAAISPYFTKKAISSISEPICLQGMYRHNQEFVDIYVLVVKGGLNAIKLPPKKSRTVVVKEERIIT
jgi:hypothetical protein